MLSTHLVSCFKFLTRTPQPGDDDDDDDTYSNEVVDDDESGCCGTFEPLFYSFHDLF